MLLGEFDCSLLISLPVRVTVRFQNFVLYMGVLAHKFNELSIHTQSQGQQIKDEDGTFSMLLNSDKVLLAC